MKFHFHIVWANGRPDWERHDTREAANESASALAHPNEVFEIREFDDADCPQCAKLLQRAAHAGA